MLALAFQVLVGLAGGAILSIGAFKLIKPAILKAIIFFHCLK